MFASRLRKLYPDHMKRQAICVALLLTYVVLVFFAQRAWDSWRNRINRR
jgi:hypothetical protein